MVAVPRIFEKIYAGIRVQIDSNPLRRRIFQQALEVGKQVSDHRLRGESLPLKLALQFQVAQKLVLNKISQAFVEDFGLPSAAELLWLESWLNFFTLVVFLFWKGMA